MRILLVSCLLILSSPRTFAESPIEAFADRHTFVVASIDIADLTEGESLANRLASFVPEAHRAEFGETLAETETPAIVEVLKRHNAREGLIAVSFDGEMAFKLTNGRAAVLRYQLLVAFDNPKQMIACAQELSPRLRGTPLAIAPVDWQHLAFVDKRHRRENHPSLGFLLRPDLVEPLTALRKQHAIAMVVSPRWDPEMLDGTMELPAVIATLVAMQRSGTPEQVEVGIDLNQDRAVVRLVAKDAATAAALQQSLPPALAAMLDSVAKTNPELDSAAVSAAISYEQDGNALKGTIPLDNPAVQQLVWVTVGSQAKQAQAGVQQNKKLNNFKQVMLALQNHHDTHRSFPAPQHFVDADGKPLLSWRVAILSFIEQKALYDRFHFDEPWDSQHNLEVAKDMPAVFADPLHPELAAKGLTTVQRPIVTEPNATRNANVKQARRSGQRYHYRPGVTFANISDGSSMTIAIADVAPEHAVPWTKPDDWEVDLESPTAKLTAEGRERVVVGFFDGHARPLKLSIDPKSLSALLTMRGSEVINRQEIED